MALNTNQSIIFLSASVLICMLSSGVEGRRFDSRPGLTKDIKIDMFSSAKQGHLGKRAKTLRPRVRIMCLSTVACLPVDCCLREQAR